jgi:hypothetical protein
MGQPRGARVKIPLNTDMDDKGLQRIEAQEKSWTAPKLFGLGVVALGIALTVLMVASQCQITPLPVLP